MIRVLHITEMLQAAGIESFIMNVYRNIDREKVQFDFLITRDQPEFYDEEIRSLGGRKLVMDHSDLSSTWKRVQAEAAEMAEMFKNGEYDIVHIHSGTPLRVFYLKALREAGVPVRIYHSHSAKVKGPHKLLKVKTMIFSLLKQKFPVWGTDYFACSEAAADWMYPKKLQNQVRVVHNGIDVDRFRFDEKRRQKIREELSLGDAFVIGHIGRFEEQKNHTFLLDIMKEVVKKKPGARLLLIGEGDLMEPMKEKARNLGISDNVLFLGVRRDIPALYDAMDVFVLPSNYEGLPVVGVEAQASGTPSLFSDQVTPETIITGHASLLPIDSAEKWADEILKLEGTGKKDASREIRKAGYDIKDTARSLQEFYLSKSEKARQA